MNESSELEKEVRELRDKVYMDSHGKISDEKWENVREGWMMPESIAWLRLKANEPLKLSNEPETKVEIVDEKIEKKPSVIEKIR